MSKPDTRERILVVAERLFRQIGYQKTTVGDIAKELRMSPANVYRFFDFEEGDPRGRRARPDGRGRSRGAGGSRAQTGPASVRLRELLKTIHRMNAERYVGDSKLHEMVEIAMEESWHVCVAHISHHRDHCRGDRARRRLGRIRGRRRAAGGALHLHRHDPVLPPADDRAMRRQAGRRRSTR